MQEVSTKAEAKKEADAEAAKAFSEPEDELVRGGFNVTTMDSPAVRCPEK